MNLPCYYCYFFCLTIDEVQLTNFHSTHFNYTYDFWIFEKI